MIFAAPYLGRRGLQADAKGCRQFSDGVECLRHGPRGDTAAAVDPGPGCERRGERGDDRAVRCGSWGGTGARAGVAAQHWPERRRRCGAAARRHPDRVLLIDWASFSRGHDGWFGEDGCTSTMWVRGRSRRSGPVGPRRCSRRRGCCGCPARGVGRSRVARSGVVRSRVYVRVGRAADHVCGGRGDRSPAGARGDAGLAGVRVAQSGRGERSIRGWTGGCSWGRLRDEVARGSWLALVVVAPAWGQAPGEVTWSRPRRHAWLGRRIGQRAGGRAGAAVGGRDSVCGGLDRCRRGVRRRRWRGGVTGGCGGSWPR